MHSVGQNVNENYFHQNLLFSPVFVLRRRFSHLSEQETPKKRDGKLTEFIDVFVVFSDSNQRNSSISTWVLSRRRVLAVWNGGYCHRLRSGCPYENIVGASHGLGYLNIGLNDTSPIVLYTSDRPHRREAIC